ncbi:MAG: malto-oligosyltrehalose synthase [Acidimicrobiales bacterium]
MGPTYRLQLSPSFGFAEAEALIPYLARLGVQCCYLSPIFEARPGSEHGYDVVDPTRIRDELGGKERFASLSGAVHRAGLEILLDIVPNHLSTFPGGPWWRDVLRLGPDSPYAPVFDISWEEGASSPTGGRKVILPILARPLDEALGLFELKVVTRTGGPVLVYLETELPLSPNSLHDESAPIGDVLEAQHYRLQWWRDWGRNYRRFFTIDDLVGVRQEDPYVFALTHSLVRELLDSGAVDALRVDHIDGLADPEQYLSWLRELAGPRPIVVEKILTGDERLRAAWPVEGTTGYEIADDISGALVDAEGLDRIARAAAADGEKPVAVVTRASKHLVVNEQLSPEVGRVAHLLGVRPEAVAAAAVEMPVYRTYASRRGCDELDRALFELACGQDLTEVLSDPRSPERLEGLARFQQLTGAAMAKGVEDTAWYRLVGKLAFMEVGGEPARDPADLQGARSERSSDSAVTMHSRAKQRVERFETSLVPGTTHDSKRSADVRARLLALSCMPGELEAGLARFGELLDDASRGPVEVPDVLERRRIAETCLAMAPFEGAGARKWDSVAERVDGALRKGAREAKTHDSWEDVNLAYEDALARAARLLLADEGRMLLLAFGPLVGRCALYGETLSLAAVVLRSCLPGVPDCYQGDESHLFALVDPDNRQPVDFEGLASSQRDVLAARSDRGRLEELRKNWPDGRLKMHTTIACLLARRELPGPFTAEAGYAPLSATGQAAVSFVGFAREGRDGTAALALVTRLPHRLDAGPGDLPVGAGAYGSTTVSLPPSLAGRSWTDALTGTAIDTGSENGSVGGRESLRLSDAFACLPVALLTSRPQIGSPGNRAAASAGGEAS